MAFGVKIKSVKTKNTYTIESLFEVIKDTEFSAGKPELTKHGMATIITFPPLDRRNQVWIMPGSLKKECNKWSIQKQEQAGLGNLAVNSALESVTNGYAGLGRMVGKNAKEAEKMVELTAKELDALGL